MTTNTAHPSGTVPPARPGRPRRGTSRPAPGILAASAFIIAVTGSISGCQAGEHQGEARLRVNRDALQVVDGKPADVGKNESAATAHAELLHSPLVLKAALNSPGASELSSVKQAVDSQNDPIDWLRERLDVNCDADEPDVLQVTVTLPAEEDAKRLARAVATAYITEVVAPERGRLLQGVEILELQHWRLEENIRGRRATYKELVDAVDGIDDNLYGQRHFWPEKKIGLAKEIGVIRTHIMRTKLDLRRLRIAGEDQAERRRAMIKRQLESNAEYVADMALLEELREDLAANGATEEEGDDDEEDEDPAEAANAAQLRSQIAESEKKLAALREQAVTSLSDDPLDAHQQHVAELEKNEQDATVHLQELLEELEEVEEKIRRRGSQTPELQQRKDELNRMEQVSNEVGLRLEKMRLDLATYRAAVTLIEPTTETQ